MQSMQKKNCDIGHRRIKKNNILIDLVIENQLSTFLNLGLVSKKLANSLTNKQNMFVQNICTNGILQRRKNCMFAVSPDQVRTNAKLYVMVMLGLIRF